MIKDYQRGYKAVKKLEEECPSDIPWRIDTPYPIEPPVSDNYNKCRVCGFVFEAGKAYHYACCHEGCPSRVTY